MRIVQEERTGYAWPVYSVILNVIYEPCVTNLKPLHFIQVWE